MEFLFHDRTFRITHSEQAALMADIHERLAIRQGFALATLNLDHMVKLQDRAEFRAAYGAHDMVVADGNPVVWLSRLAGRPVDLLPGSDLMRPLLQAAAAQGAKVAFVGSNTDTLRLAADRLVAEIPALDIALMIAPQMGFDPTGEDARSILRQLEGAGIGLCLIAMGAPKQELFAALGREVAPSVGFASIGAGLDFVAGSQRRAPWGMRIVALEWVWRMALQPRRMGPRYMACIAVLPGQAMAALRLRSRTRAAVRLGTTYIR